MNNKQQYQENSKLTNYTQNLYERGLVSHMTAKDAFAIQQETMKRTRTYIREDRRKQGASRQQARHCTVAMSYR